MSRLSTMLIATFLLAGCEARSEAVIANQRNAIVGGTPTEVDRWPGTVRIETDGNDGLCAGTLLAPEWVLTAAHCVSDPRRRAASVLAGRSVLSTSAGSRIAIDEAIVHEAYDPETLDNDIALLRLAEPALHPVARLIDPLVWRSLGGPGLDVDIVGWGTTALSGPQSDGLQHAAIELVDFGACRESLSRLGYAIADNVLCAGAPGGGRDACFGDSGGPLFASVGETRVQIGIVSWGVSCALAGVPGVYTSVADFSDWIEKHVHGNTAAVADDGEPCCSIPMPPVATRPAGPPVPPRLSAPDSHSRR